MGTGDTITFHRGGKTSPVLATAECCQEKQGSSKIEFVEPSSTVVLEHLPRRMIVLPPKTTFKIGDRSFYWKGYTDLFEEKTEKLYAQYTPKMTDGAETTTGQLLVIETDDQKINDLAVISTVIMQQRSDARRRAVYILTNLL
jgi:hypothetical protein